MHSAPRTALQACPSTSTRAYAPRAWILGCWLLTANDRPLATDYLHTTSYCLGMGITPDVGLDVGLDMGLDMGLEMGPGSRVVAVAVVDVGAGALLGCCAGVVGYDGR
ncbi:hypothetical protein C7974DRAFT_380138 [Boeremia exigua]|uniref:uncharacterized protein n=1 Tax=Boeremia exigua TaxID=749465 RepID=UPI001E8D3FBA|nr:uncharacterized protein C7974DRAFT_380138 [Boeremia exigua]KAH6615285.1 hypothetical protein C7974DRAFT_380138 [Boeremia exigua]